MFTKNTSSLFLVAKDGIVEDGDLLTVLSFRWDGMKSRSPVNIHFSHIFLYVV